MSAWVDRILQEFPGELSRLWIVADPDEVLLDEQVLSGLRVRGFEVVPFEDSLMFRAEYEQRYRAAWDRDLPAPSQALILQYRGTDIRSLPWDYLRQARSLSLSLAELFPKLSYGVVRRLGPALLPSLFDAQARHAQQNLGDNATKEFALTHLFRINPHLIQRNEDFWGALLRLHYHDVAVPDVLGAYVEQILQEQAEFRRLPIQELLCNKNAAMRAVQDAWDRHLSSLGVVGTRTGEPTAADYITGRHIPFDHPDVRSYVDSMFLDGTLHPLVVQHVPATVPDWMRIGLVQDPSSMQRLVLDGIEMLKQDVPATEASHREWTHYAQRFGEILSRVHGLDASRADGTRTALENLQGIADDRLQQWVAKHFADLPSLSPAKGPILVHHIPRYLAMQRSGHGEEKIALVVFDGLAIDQWVQIRERLVAASAAWTFDEQACFAWIPTLTSVSRQALFSGLRPREFADSIDTTSREPALWARFWQDQGLRSADIAYRRSIKRIEDLDELQEDVTRPNVRVAGIVVDMVDEIVHGALLGKRGIASMINSWCDTMFVEKLFRMLLDHGYSVYLTADHGNVEASGIGRPNQGLASELRGERVRTYRNEQQANTASISDTQGYRLDVAGLPADFIPVFAKARGAFVAKNEQLVVHGGISVEELIVPFVKVSCRS